MGQTLIPRRWRLRIIAPVRTRSDRFWLWLLPLVLIGAQWLALVHGVLHLRLGAAGPQAPATTRAPAAETPSLGVDALFAGHAGNQDCRLYDQLAGGDHAPPLAALDVPAAGAPDGPPRWVQRAWAARLVPHFSARAPPALG